MRILQINEWPSEELRYEELKRDMKKVKGGLEEGTYGEEESGVGEGQEKGSTGGWSDEYACDYF